MLATLMAFDISGAEIRLEQLRKVEYRVVTLAGMIGASVRLEQSKKV